MGEQVAVVVVDVDVDQWGDGVRRQFGEAAYGGRELVVAPRSTAEHQAERGMVVSHPAEVTLEAQLGHRLAVSSTRRGLGDRRHEPVADLVEERPIQVTLGVEVLVEHRLGDAGRLGDVVHRRVVIAVHGERLERHREDLFTPRGSGEANGHRYHRVTIHRPRSRSSRSAAFTA